MQQCAMPIFTRTACGACRLDSFNTAIHQTISMCISVRADEDHIFSISHTPVRATHVQGQEGLKAKHIIQTSTFTIICIQ